MFLRPRLRRLQLISQSEQSRLASAPRGELTADGQSVRRPIQRHGHRGRPDGVVQRRVANFIERPCDQRIEIECRSVPTKLVRRDAHYGERITSCFWKNFSTTAAASVKTLSARCALAWRPRLLA